MSVFLSIYSITAATASTDPSCSENLKTWCVLALICCLFHGIFALYYFFLFVKLGQEKGLIAVNMQHEAREIFCYDPWTAIYILIYIFSFVWGIIGTGYASDEKTCTGSDLKKGVESISVFLIVYGACTPIVIMFGIFINQVRVGLQATIPASPMLLSQVMNLVSYLLLRVLFVGICQES